MSNSGIPVSVRAVNDVEMLRNGMAVVVPERPLDFVDRVGATENGRSSKVFQLEHCGQRPSHRADSNPHAEQKKTLRALATDGAREHQIVILLVAAVSAMPNAA
jgi:hypothetical protein